MAPGSIPMRRYYESFSMLAGRATRDGVLKLANRPDVQWVTLDAVRHRHHATAQNAQVLMQSDQTNALGFDGAGQAIAVLDTGVDYTVPELGGGGFPNAKVIGRHRPRRRRRRPYGLRRARHVRRSRRGGPEASRRARRSSRSRCRRAEVAADTAFVSDIIAGNQLRDRQPGDFAITAINLSFGGILTRRLDHGYCDESFPQYAAALESAIAAGIVVRRLLRKRGD